MSMIDPKSDDGEWLLQWVVPEEDRRAYTSTPNGGGYRRFRAANVVCLETWRRKKRRQPDSQARDPRPVA